MLRTEDHIFTPKARLRVTCTWVLRSPRFWHALPAVCQFEYLAKDIIKKILLMIITIDMQ